MSTHWVVTSSTSQARIFDKTAGKPHAVKTINHPESRDSKQLNAQEEDGIAKLREKPRFAHEIFSYIAAGDVHDVSLLAPADMLHALREQLKSGRLKSSIKESIAKGLIHHDAREIERILVH